jgi:hypothetical protein
MAGVKGRSGRRSLLETAEEFALPEMGETEDSIRVYLAAVAVGVAKRQLDPRTADSLIRAGTGALSAMKQKNQRLEMYELQKMLDEAKAVVKAGKAHEVADRQQLSDEREASDE